jgi:hypothetical protein
MNQGDEIVLNVLLAEGLDVPTALAAASSGGSPAPSPLGSIINEPRPTVPQGRNAGASRTVGVLIGVVVALAYLAWRSL